MMTEPTKSRWLGVIAIECLVGLLFLAGYQAWVRPSAPRTEAAAATPAPAPQAAATPEPEPPRPSPVEAPVVPPSPAPPPQTPPPGTKAVVRQPRKQTTAVSNDELLRQAQSALNAKDWAGSLRSLDQLQLQAKGANPDIGYLRGMALENLGQIGAAIDAFRSCTSGPYASIAANHVKMLAAKLRK